MINMRKSLILLAPLFLMILAAPAFAATVDVSYCVNSFTNDTVYRMTQDIHYNELNASSYWYSCFYDGSGTAKQNITIDMNGFTYYPSNSSTAPGSFLVQQPLQLGYNIKNGTIDLTNITTYNSFNPLYLLGYPFTISNLTVLGAGKGRFGIVVQFDGCGGARDSIFQNFVTYDTWMPVTQSCIASCNVTYGTAYGAVFSSAPCGNGTTTTTTTTVPDAFAESSAAAVQNLAAYTGAIVGSDATGGKFLLWTILSLAVSGYLIIWTKAEWLYGAVALLVFMGLGIAVNFVPMWIGVAIIVLGAALVAKSFGLGGD